MDSVTDVMLGIENILKVVLLAQNIYSHHSNHFDGSSLALCRVMSISLTQFSQLDTNLLCNFPVLGWWHMREISDSVRAKTEGAEMGQYTGP